MDRIKNRILNKIRFFVKHGMIPVSNLIIVVNPFLCVLLYSRINDISRVFVAAFLNIVLSYVIKLLSDILNTGKAFPVPYKRFTVEDEYEGITVNRSDLEEMILFMNDYENWLDRNGYVSYRKSQESSRDA